MTKNCLKCKKEYEAKRSTGKYCSPRCRKLAFEGKPVSVLMQNLEKKSLKQLRKESYWIPNWKRKGLKSREEAFADLLAITQQHQGIYMFQGLRYVI